MRRNNHRKPQRHASTLEFFRGRVQDAIDHRGVETSETAEFYLVTLLDEYHEASKFFSMEGDGPVMKPLAQLLHEAHLADEARKRKYLKRLGDTALYVSGFFADYIHRSLVNREYYIGMGGSAYSSLSAISRQKAMQELFHELAVKFNLLVDILAEVAPWSKHIDNQRLVQIYARWLESGDERLKEILDREGIDTTEELHTITP